MTLSCRELINCDGLFAPQVAGRIVGLSLRHIPLARLCKSSYFSFSGRIPFRHLVYPAPEAADLDVHMTLDRAGQARFGLNVEWIEHGVPGLVNLFGIESPVLTSYFALAERAVQEVGHS